MEELKMMDITNRRIEDVKQTCTTKKSRSESSNYGNEGGVDRAKIVEGSKQNKTSASTPLFDSKELLKILLKLGPGIR